MTPPPFLDKALEAIQSAEFLTQSDRVNSATNRAYYAMFHAARAALIAAKISGVDQNWSHEAIQSQFAVLSRRRKAYPAELAADLAWVRGVRHIADYRESMVSSRQAKDALRRATRFVSAIQAEIDPHE
jgi:uncharacterized protein (UPF0332 family)